MPKMHLPRHRHRKKADREAPQADLPEVPVVPKAVRVAILKLALMSS